MSIEAWVEGEVLRRCPGSEVQARWNVDDEACDLWVDGVHYRFVCGNDDDCFEFVAVDGGRDEPSIVVALLPDATAPELTGRPAGEPGGTSGDRP